MARVLAYAHCSLAEMGEARSKTATVEGIAADEAV